MVLSRARAASPTPAPIDYDRDIRPILSENCYACHGPDEAKRKAGLRLDQHEGVLKKLKSGDHAVVPGNLEQSAMVYRITTTDQDDHMPPPESGKKLSPHQVELLRRWIAEGAKWKGHWAFVPPVRPDPPAVQDPSWPRNDIDRFVLARLEKEHLKPAPEAAKAKLIRRASLDLTGLPPTVDEVDSFLADGSPDAYEKLVDRLLSSPRYGENMAKYWLDAVRYSDTHGYHIDSRRDVWKYRDWVMDAFNSDKPYSQFTIEQLAGDLLPNSTLDQKIASGYVRLNMSTGEGGAIEEEYRAKYTFDRVETTGTVFLGMTLMCARCHSHKFDPIEHKEYYSLYAIFNQMDGPILDGNVPNPAPFIKVPSKAQSERLAWLKSHLEDAEQQLAAANPSMDDSQTAWAHEWNERLNREWARLHPDSAKSTLSGKGRLKVLEDQSVRSEEAAPDQIEDELSFHPTAGLLGALRLEALPDSPAPADKAEHVSEAALRLSEFEADLIQPGDKDGASRTEKLKFSRAAADVEEKGGEADKAIDGNKDTGWRVQLGTHPHTAVFVLDEPVMIKPGTEVRIRLHCQLGQGQSPLKHFRVAAAQNEELNHWLHPPGFSPWQVLGPLPAPNSHAALAASFPPETKIDLKQKLAGVREQVGWSEDRGFRDGQANLLVEDLHGVHGVRYLYRTLTLPSDRPMDIDLRADGLFRLWINGEMIGERDHQELPGEGPLTVTAHLRAGENQFLLKIVTVQGAAYFTFRPDLGSPDSLSPELAAILAATDSPSGRDAAQLRQYYRRQHSKEFRQLDSDFVHWREEQQTIERSIPTTLVAKDVDKPRETHELLRGDYDKLGDIVQPNVPALFPPIPKGYRTNRLGLAMWLVNPNHPLTARVAVNRFWQQVFGIGLVKTTEDFGMQGEEPSHPQLLDWLATEFIRSGWDVKHMMRLMVTSSTYRQSAQATEDLITRDPENRLLARGPRFRMDAEMLRDTSLYVSGLLVDREGGPSVRPYEPGGLWEAVSYNNAQRYVQDTGPAQYRRSLYTFWKRQSPPPNMLIFDAPTRESCVVRRSRSNTPLQALDLLNDPQYVEASRAFAERILLEGGKDVESRLRYAFRLATSRAPTADELEVLRRVYQQQQADFQQHPKSVDDLLAVGSFETRPGLDKEELATWSILGRLLLNLDETITKG